MKIVTIVGARPQFVKAAAVSRAVQTYNQSISGNQTTILELLVHTGQHYDRDMSDIFFEELGIPEPAYNLGIGSGSHGRQTGEMLRGIEEALLREQPDWLLAYGDTNSTLAGALAAVKLHIPVAHVEAGLRSHNRCMPEEINRVLTDHVSTLLLCPTETAVKNLKDEGIKQGVHLVGDVMYDAVLHDLPVAERRSAILRDLGLQPKGYHLATVHRAENTDDTIRLDGILAALQEISRIRPVVWPMHPRTRQVLSRLHPSLLADAIEDHSTPIPGRAGTHHGLRAINPVSYFDMLVLEKNAKLILTDSGGVQKEAYWLGVPCVTLRDETEWVETVEVGWNVLAGADRDQIVRLAETRTPPGERPALFGAGDAAKRTIEVLAA
ncbi:MAG: UDP-N-acetylglucosamine 2-epimerase [Armatimonadetes bacterium CG2_30_59_28]|nr:UDP-N-acetylglucosamine 2-epimerase (non-hydrolyzing) [Armatimonadota bacterium]OIO95934.1 MAG: UDP-N-acetylglucosamine 2-epimerase [Armatimonadetes bacterium CG2_30_59_28]